MAINEKYGDNCDIEVLKCSLQKRRFFFLLRYSGERRQARVTRDGRGAPLVARDSRSALASHLPQLV